MSFRKAYQKTAAVVNFAEKGKKKLNELTLEELRKIEPKLKDDVLKVFNLKNSINSKKSYGGTSFYNIKKMIMKYKKEKSRSFRIFTWKIRKCLWKFIFYAYNFKRLAIILL